MQFFNETWPCLKSSVTPSFSPVVCACQTDASIGDVVIFGDASPQASRSMA